MTRFEQSCTFAEKMFPETVTTALLILTVTTLNPWLAATTVASLGLVLAKSIASEKIAATKTPAGVPEEVRRLIHDLGVRVTTIEYGIRTRGF